MVRTTIHVMRHGEVYNPEGILYGRRPGYHLSALGAAMAQRVAHVLSATGHDVVAVITSPLERARESGAPTAEAFGLTPTTDVRLTEAGNHFEGVPVNRDRRVLTHPQHWRYYVNPLRPSWGEPYVDLVARMAAAVRDAVPLAQGHEALLVSHQLPIWSLRLWLEGRLLAHDPRRRQCSLASLTSLTFEGRTLTGLAYWEPAGDLLRQAEDMVPGTSAASEKMGDAGAAGPETAPAAPAGRETSSAGVVGTGGSAGPGRHATGDGAGPGKSAGDAGAPSRAGSAAEAGPAAPAAPAARETAPATPAAPAGPGSMEARA